MNPVIAAEKLTKRFGNFLAVDNVTFTVAAGEVVGYLGPNGSGKTTTLHMLLGLLHPTSGQAQVLGCDIVRQAEQIRRQVGYMSQKFALYHDLTVAENLEFYSGVYGVRDPRRVEAVLARLGLSDAKRRRVSDLSTGWRQRLALGVAIVHRPALLFLDEPTSGVDPQARRDFWELIYALVEEGVTALVTTHYMDEAEYCGRVGIMRAGRLEALGTPTALKQAWVTGNVWDISAEPLLTALTALSHTPGVQRIRLAGDHLRAITLPTLSAADLSRACEAAQIRLHDLALSEPTLEDAFLALATADDHAA